MLERPNQEATLESDMHGVGKKYDGVDMESTKSILEEISSDKYDELVARMSTADLKTYSEVHTIAGITFEFIGKINNLVGSTCMMNNSEKVVRDNAASNVQTTFNKATLVSFAGAASSSISKPKRVLCALTLRDEAVLPNAMTIPTVDMTNDGFQVVLNKRKSSKTGSTTNRSSVDVADQFEDGSKPSSSFFSAYSKMGGRKAHTNSSNIPTSNLYELLSQEFDLENYTRNGHDLNLVQDDLESEEEVEVVFNETT
ncbi:hypothetical protein Tco_1421325, partial [Tanacetum coccineum]